MNKHDYFTNLLQTLHDIPHSTLFALFIYYYFVLIQTHATYPKGNQITQEHKNGLVSHSALQSRC